MNVSLQALKAFDASARRGSFKLAAEELSLTPTAISHHISNLESRLSVDLFIRKPRQIELTEVGKYLAQATSEGFNRIERAVQEIHASGNHIRVTTTSSFAALVLIPALQEFYQQHPQISVEISTGEAIDKHAFVLPIRFGQSGHVASDEIIKRERFNVYANPAVSWPPSGEFNFVSTTWKNKNLPSPPLSDWLALNGYSDKTLKIQRFDQELFGIQEALFSNKLVFCSGTLVQRYIEAGMLVAVGKEVNSEFCYYLSDRGKNTNRAHKVFISWLTNMLH